jgi:hypothetical protein
MLSSVQMVPGAPDAQNHSPNSMPAPAEQLSRVKELISIDRWSIICNAHRPDQTPRIRPNEPSGTPLKRETSPCSGVA